MRKITRENPKLQASPEITVEQKLKMLYELQTVLSKIDEIRIMRGELPLEVQDLEDDIEGISTRIAKVEEEIRELDANIARWKEEKNVAQTAIERNNEKLNEVRNSRQYDAVSKEIEYQGLEVQLREKKINDALTKRKERLETITANQERKEEKVKDLAAKRQELEEIITETKTQEDELREKAEELESRMEMRLLTAFKRIRRSSRNGLGIVYVQRDACGGCFNKIPPQKQLDVRMRKKIIICEYCGRIMIDPELAGVKVQPKEEEEPKKVRRRRTTKKTEEED